MRRQPTVTENPYYHINYNLQDKRELNGWTSKGKTSVRSPRKKKSLTSKNRESVEVCAMAASVLPTGNAYNDYYVKYHSVSKGSALSQSMKYAEAWLYGSLGVKSSPVRTALLNFDHDIGGQGFADRVKALPGRLCTTHGCPDYASTLICNKCVIPIRQLNSVQAFGTVRAKNGSQVHFYPPLQQYASDPYDLVRQSRLGGTKNLPIAARSHSQSKRKQVPATEQFLQGNERHRRSEGRRSILECDINPYDLVAKVSSVGDDNSDDDLTNSPLIESSKKHKPTLKSNIRMKVQDAGANKLKNNKKAGKAIAADSAHGISIAGQKIRILNTSNKTVDDSQDWISDPSVSDEPETPNKIAEGLEAPKRPPRKKSIRNGILKTVPAGDITPIYENYKEALSQEISSPSIGITITDNTCSMTTNCGDIKSILKKPLNSSTTIKDSGSETSRCLVPFASGKRAVSVPCNDPLEYRVCSSEADGRGSGTAGAEHYVEDANFYRTAFSHCQQSTRSGKVKKQVQFKGMQERTTEDESGFMFSSPHDVHTSSRADLRALSIVDETGCTVSETTATTIASTTTTRATQTNTLPVTTPMSQRADAEGQLDAVQVYDDFSNVARPTSQGVEGAKCRLDLTSSSSPVFVNECLVVSPTAKSSFSCGSVCGSTAKCASDCTSGISERPNGVLKPVSRLHRTLSECLTPRPSLASVHCEAFKDTMRLRVRCNPQIEPRRLFCAPNIPRDTHDKLSQRARRICSRPAIPPPLPPCEPNKMTSVPNVRVTVPQLHHRQYFSFSKSGHHNVNTMNGDAVADNNVDEVRIPSLTRTFLQHRTYPGNDTEKENSPYHSGSVIKINVTSRPEDMNVQLQNRTIVTITPPECPKVPLTKQQDSNGKTCITINVNDESPLNALSAGSGSNTITTINVGYDEPKSTPVNDSSFRSNVLVTTPPNANTVYVKSPQSAALPATEMEEVSRQEQRSGDNTPVEAPMRVCTCDCGANKMSIRTSGSSSNSGSSSSSLLSADSAVTEMSAVNESNDFSVHYMSCRIDEQLTEDEVGLTRKLQENEYDSTEPIYEEISETPPPLPLEPPPDKVDDIGIVIPPKSIFEGASKYDILKYLAGAKERCKIPEEPCPRFVVDEVADLDATDLPLTISHTRNGSLDLSSHHGHSSNVSDSSDELANFLMSSNRVSSVEKAHKNFTDIERNDSGVGSETSKCSRSKWQHHVDASSPVDQQLMCEDCEQPVETQLSDGSWTYAYAPLVCCKCSKKRIERREIIAEIVETEEKYGRDLRIILDEFYQPMLVAGLLTPEQLSSIFLNVEELLEHNRVLAEKLRDGYEIAVEQGDEDLLTFNVGKIFLDSAPMLHAFESYCTRQGNAALLLANLEKDKELLKIFLRVSQMENTVLRRMNLNSFLMVPVQRVTKYPLLLARLYKVTPDHLAMQRELLKEAQHNIELHLEHINSLTKDIGSMKLWRRISMMNGRRVSGDADDIINIKLQKIAVEVLEWGHEEVRFAMEGRLLYAQPTDYNWKRTGRTIKVVSVNALLVTLGKPTENYNVDCENQMMFPPKNGIRDASLLLMKEKGGKYSLVRDPLFLDHCIIYCDSDCDEYFEVQEIPTKDTYIFKAEDEERTRQWYKQLQYHSQGLGCWRRRRNALANIMINGMQVRS